MKNCPISIGGYFQDVKKNFIMHSFTVNKGDNLFIYSDGFIDQFGGPNDKRYGSKRLVEFIDKIRHLSTKDQNDLLSKEFYDWKKHKEQIDDVLIMSIKF